MKYCRFRFENQVMYGAVEERGGEPWIVDLAAAPEEDLAFHLAHARALAAKELVIDPAGFDFEPMPLDEAELLPPVTPSKIICVGRNYREHAKELGNEVPTEPLLFFKPPSSLLGHKGTVLMPPQSERVDFEGELALVIARRASKLPADADWRSYVRGYTIANDVTARDLQKKDGQWTRAKGFDTFLRGGAGGEQRRRSGEGTRGGDACERRVTAARIDVGFYLLDSGAANVYHGSHYA